KKTLMLLEKEPEHLDVRDRHVPVSVVAIELVGLIDYMEGHNYQSVLSRFRILYNEIQRTVHGLGGLMIPGYQGRFVCVFGDSLIEGRPVLRHAERALQAAVQLQKDQAL